ncbi:MAG: enoyl-CoA hydratase/isomerase family protein [Acidimicrobiia bacterium]
MERLVGLGWDGAVAVLTLQRPDMRNAFSAALLRALREALHDPALDEAGALVVTGAGGTFCAGGDVSEMGAAVAGDTDAVMGPMVTDLHQIIARLRSIPVPVVAAVNGPAIGAGMGLALAADLRVVGRSAVLVPGYLAVGASPDAGVSYFLTRALGGARALSALLLNRPFDTDALAQAGLVEEVVDDHDVLSAAVTLAQRVAGTSAASLLAARRLIDRAPTHELVDHLNAEEAEFRRVWVGSDFKEGVTAFLERRKPVFGVAPSTPAEV